MKELELNWEVDTMNKQGFRFTGSEINNIGDGTNGIYIIWLPNFPLREILKFGQGDIKLKLQDHLLDSKITKYDLQVEIAFSWAKVNSKDCDGIVKFLGSIFTERAYPERILPDCEPIKINLPIDLN